MADKGYARTLVSRFRLSQKSAEQSFGDFGCMIASLIGRLGQARFPSFSWIIVTHPGHASLRSLVDAVLAPLHACVGLVVESLALRRASRCAADIFGFFHRPRPVRGDAVRLWLVADQIMLCPPTVPDGTRCHLPTFYAAGRPTFWPPRQRRGGVLWFASVACPRI